MTGSVCQTHAERRLKSSWPRPETPSNCGWAPQRYAFSQKVGQKKRGRAGKRKSPSGVFYTAVFGKKEAGNGETPLSPDFTPGFLRAVQNYIFFSFTLHSRKEFFQTGPKTGRYKDFRPKVDKLHVQTSESLRELPKKQLENSGSRSRSGIRG